MSDLEQQLRNAVRMAQQNMMAKAALYLSVDGERFHLMLRWSRPKWDGYETIDVVQIAWLPFLMAEQGLEAKRKRSAAPLWDALEKTARSFGRILRVECIGSEKLADFLRRERGYMAQSNDETCLLCIKQ